MKQKIKAVEAIFTELEEEISLFKVKTGLNCVTGCGACCKKPDIEATVLEFLPLAHYFYLKGEAENIYDKLLSDSRDICIIFKSLFGDDTNSGICSEYKYRGLICRLFGFSARVNKYGSRELATCRVIKEIQADQYNKAVLSISSGADIPVMHDYYSKLRSIDPNLGEKTFPVNVAICRAVEYVLTYYTYRKPPVSGRAA